MNLRKLIGTIVSIAILFFIYKAFFASAGEEANPNKIYTVQELKSHVRELEGKIVNIKGTVVHSGSLGFGGYTLDDGTGKITVLTTKAVPNKGETYKVKGKLSELLKVGNERQITLTEQEAVMFE